MICCVAVQVIKHTIRAKPHPERQALRSQAALSHIHHTDLGHHSVCHTETVCRVSLVALDCLTSQLCNFKKAGCLVIFFASTFVFTFQRLKSFQILIKYIIKLKQYGVTGTGTGTGVHTFYCKLIRKHFSYQLDNVDVF